MTLSKTANISDIFSSIQGEGLYLGAPQVFIRFTGCNLVCRYCDTPNALRLQKTAKIEQAPFSDKYKPVLNPLSGKTIIDSIAQLKQNFGSFHSIALTGGEPLAHSGFLSGFLPNLKKLSLPIFLETNGTLSENLEKVISLIDIISMDIKNPADLVKGKSSLEETKTFLKISLRKKCYVKIVVTASSGLSQVRLNARDEASLLFYLSVALMIKKTRRSIPVILQPEFSCKKYYAKDSLLFQVYKLFNAQIPNVRIIPQVHKLAYWR